MVTLLHESGVEFDVFLNKYEIKECVEGKFIYYFNVKEFTVYS